jgi:hypothetical protein
MSNSRNHTFCYLISDILNNHAKLSICLNFNKSDYGNDISNFYHLYILANNINLKHRLIR